MVSAIALGLQAQEGADFKRYAQWTKAFGLSDILKIQSEVLSPVGVPMTHWSHAPGLITDAIARVLSFLPFVNIGLHAVAWLAAIAFWWALIGLLRLATRRDPVLFVFALATAFVGTHAGFYSIFHSSEIFALSTFAVAAFWALSAGPGLCDSLIVGIATGLLLAVRVNLAMYAVLPIASRAFIVWRGSGKRLNKALVLHAFAVGFPLLVYGAQLLQFNYWETGSPSRSPYVYGDAAFQSVDFAHPMFGTMLFHSWHGLLAYHPLFVLGPLALAALALRRDLPLPERLFAGYALLALFAQFYVQASWWCWWNGRGTFGNRTLAVASVVVVVAVARLLLLLRQSVTRKSKLFAGLLLAVSAASCFWSFLLYVQGHSNFATWRELLHAQRKVLTSSSILVPACFAMALSLGFALVAFRTLRLRAVFLGVTAFVATVAAQALFANVVRGWAVQWKVQSLTTASLVVVNVFAFAGVIYLVLVRYAPSSPMRQARAAVAGALLCVFVVGSWSFAELALTSQSVIARSTAKPRNYQYRAAMVVDDLLGCVPEYETVPGFTERKAAFRHFIESAAVEAHERLLKPRAGAWNDRER